MHDMRARAAEGKKKGKVRARDRGPDRFLILYRAGVCFRFDAYYYVRVVPGGAGGIIYIVRAEGTSRRRRGQWAYRTMTYFNEERYCASTERKSRGWMCVCMNRLCVLLFRDA